MLTINLTGVQPFPVRQSMGDANSIFNSSGTTEVYLNVVLTAARTLTLPAASAFPAGTELIFVDEIGGITETNTVTITRAGSDLINGATTLVINSVYSTTKLITDGISNWTANNNIGYSTGTWVPSITGFSAAPTSVEANYILIGKLCTATIFMVAGTSNAGTMTITFPFTAKNGITKQISSQLIMNNGVQSIGQLQLLSNSNIGQLYISSGASFTSSGSKAAYITVTYIIN